MSNAASPSRQQFAKWVRSALNQIYDFADLQTHPLASALADEEAGPLDRAQNLRKVLLREIREMQPPPGVPTHSPDWRAYRILEMRYVEGLSTDEAMERLALQKSQYFRDQSRALQALTARLWDRHEPAQTSGRGASDPRPGPQESLLLSEADRLCAEVTWEEVDVSRLLDDLIPVVRSLSRARQSPVRIITSPPLRIARCSRVLLRQAVLSAVSYVLGQARGALVEVSSFVEEQERGIRIRAEAAGPLVPSHQVPSGGVARLGVCRRLMAAMGGLLRLDTSQGSCWEAALVWPTPTARTLLVVDDNRSFADLFHRYLAGRGWRVIGACNGAQARQSIARVRPDVITLDVLMPQEDGWELLMAFTTGADTCHIPIIVCSVLEEPELALSLGATAYLPKPVTERSLLRALAPWNRAAPSPGPAPPD